MARRRLLPKRAYLDSQFCIAYLAEHDPDHSAARELAETFAGITELADYRCYVSILTVDEVMWKLGGVLYDRDHGPGAWRQTTGRNKRAAFSRLSDDIASIVEDFLSESWIRPLPIEENAYAMLPSVMRGQDLRPADVCHLALAWAAGCGVVTNDRDFHTLEDAPVEVVGY